MILSAQPSAINTGGSGYPDSLGYTEYGYNSSYATLDVNLNPASGLIDVYTYYPTTTASVTSPGGVAGWAYQTAVAQGGTQAETAIGTPGGPVLQTSTDYIAGSNTVNGVTPYFTSQTNQYPTAGLGQVVEATLQPATNFHFSGTWTAYSNPAGPYDQDSLEAAASGQATATWTLGSLTPGKQYEVLVTWAADPQNGATDAPFSVYDGSSNNLLLEQSLDQTQGPASGGVWESLGVFTATSSSVYVQLTNNAAGGCVVADAVQVVEVRPTSYTYTFNNAAIASMTTTLPVVGSSENGTGAAAQTTDVYNSYGQLVWSMDGNGAISYTQYDPASGAVIEQIQDVNLNPSFQGNSDDRQFQTDLGLIAGLNWTTPANGVANLITSYHVDSEGRTTEEIDPDNDVTYTVYDDADHEVRVYPGWYYNADSRVYETTGPVEVYREDWANSYTESLTYSFTDGWSPNSAYVTDDAPNGTELLTNSNVVIRSLSRSLLDQTGQVISTLDYYSLSGVTYSASSPLGSSTANYQETDYTYDSMGRAESTIDPAGTIGFTVYDYLGNVTDQWSGTRGNSTASNSTIILDFRTWVHTSGNQNTLTYTGDNVDLCKTAHNVYNVDGCLTATTAYVDGTTGERVTAYGYDWQDRQTYVVSPANAQGYIAYTMTTYDNLDEAITSQQYQYEGMETIPGIPDPLANATASPPAPLNSTINGGDILLAQSTTAYDALGQVYQSVTDQVANGAVVSGEAQTTEYWYDADGNEVALEDPDDNGTVWAYNGLDQQTQSVQGQMITTPADGSGPWTFTNLEQSTLTASARTYQVYVHFSTTPDSGWQGDYWVSDPNAKLSTTTFTPSIGGWYLLGTVTLPANDSTTVRLNDSGSGSDEVCLGYGDQSLYYPDGTPGAGQLETYTDRDGRATTYQYNFVGQETGENWSNAAGTTTETESFIYNPAGLLQSATDQVTGAEPATDSYVYDLAGEVLSDSQSVPGLTPAVILSEGYTAGNRTTLSANFGGSVDSTTGVVSDGTNDFVNTYTYGGVMGQMSQVTQQSPTVGDTVAAKTATFQYDWQDELTYVDRYQNSDATANLVAQATYQYDNDGNMTSLVYARSGNTATLPSYSWTYDAQNNMASATNSDGTVSYTSDSTGQLRGQVAARPARNPILTTPTATGKR